MCFPNLCSVTVELRSELYHVPLSRIHQTNCFLWWYLTPFPPLPLCQRRCSHTVLTVLTGQWMIHQCRKVDDFTSLWGSFLPYTHAHTHHHHQGFTVVKEMETRTLLQNLTSQARTWSMLTFIEDTHTYTSPPSVFVLFTVLTGLFFSSHLTRPCRQERGRGKRLHIHQGLQQSSAAEKLWHTRSEQKPWNSLCVYYSVESWCDPLIIDTISVFSEDLLREFFDFYATFPFSKMSINIRTVSVTELISRHLNQYSSFLEWSCILVGIIIWTLSSEYSWHVISQTQNLKPASNFFTNVIEEFRVSLSIPNAESGDDCIQKTVTVTESLFERSYFTSF